MKSWEILWEESLMVKKLFKKLNFVSYWNYKTWETTIFTTVKEHAKKFEDLQVPVIRGKFELFTSFIQTNYINQYVICLMAQWIKYLLCM